jgi:hypothetical protein
MAKPTAEELDDAIRSLVQAQGGNFDKVGIPAIKVYLRQKGFEEPESLVISLAKGRLKEEASPVKKAPFKDAYPKPFPEFSFQYWFNYFYVELPNPDRKQYYFSQITNPDGSYKPIETLNKKLLLHGMRDEGFVAFKIGEKLDPEVLFQEAVKKGHEILRDGIRVVFRGDGRLPQAIEQHKGTLPQSRLANKRLETHMDQVWHPFYDAENKVYFRKGFNEDNCLFTAISVSPDFYIATKFPLLSELQATNPSAIGTSVVEIARTAVGPGSNIRDRASTMAAQSSASNLSTMQASKTNIYAVKITGGWNTQNWQKTSTFPEYAFEHIPWIYHLACFKVIRIHYGPDPNLGHRIVIEGWEWLQPKPMLNRLLYGDANVAKLEGHLESLYRKCSPEAGGISHVPDGMPAPPQITKIVNVFIPGASKLKMDQYGKSNATGAPLPQLKPARVGSLGADKLSPFQRG